MKDGHEKRTSDTTHTNANTPDPNLGNVWDGKFITENEAPLDWLMPQDGTLWQSVDSPNNVCPDGFRIPTKAEWIEEEQSWGSDGGPFENLKLTMGGYRINDGVIHGVGDTGYYWAESEDGGYAFGYTFNLNGSNTNAQPRSYGKSVRCIKD